MKLEKFHDILKPFIEALNYLPIAIEYNNKTIYTKDIAVDGKIMEVLKKI